MWGLLLVTVLRRLPQLSLPTLVIHGERDDIIPIGFGRQVFEAVKSPKWWYAIPGADHNNTYHVGGAPYFRQITEFVQRALRM